MIGRQVCVTLCLFVVALVATLNIVIGQDDNLFGVSDGVHNFFNTSLLGAVITTNLGSISWQLVESESPLDFFSKTLIYVIIRICLFLESNGICYRAWVLDGIHKRVSGFKRNEEYIGTAEERAKNSMTDDNDKIGVDVGHMVKLPVFSGGVITAGLEELTRQDPSVRDYLLSLSNHGNHNDKEEVNK